MLSAPADTSRSSAPLRQAARRGLTLAEVILALGVLAVGILTLVGYMTTIHRAAREGKNQAMATMHARSILERVRDSATEFALAATPAGYTQTRNEVLLAGEAAPENNEETRRGATVFNCTARAQTITTDIYSIVVDVRWAEQGRERKVVLESRATRPPR